MHSYELLACLALISSAFVCFHVTQKEYPFWCYGDTFEYPFRLGIWTSRFPVREMDWTSLRLFLCPLCHEGGERFAKCTPCCAYCF